MKLTVFHSDKGDCTLVTAASGHRLLADGGMGSSYTESVAPELTKLLADKKHKQLDVVYVSHIDDDHIGGVLALLDDLMAWRVFDHQKKIGNTAAKAPDAPRPPDITEIWHNGFSDLLSHNAGAIESQLAESAAVLSGFSASDFPDDALHRAVAEHQDLAESVPQAIKLSRRIANGQLGITLNKPAGGKLMMRRTGAKSIKLGSLEIFVLAPAEADIKRLRDDWNKWLKANQSTLATINAKGKADATGLTNADPGFFTRPLINEAVSAAVAMSASLANDVSKPPGKPLGTRSSITPPNLASLMLFVKDGARTLLLTGDGYADDVTEGLRRAGQLPATGLHVDVLKVPHHGATDNMTLDFASKITADHYVFCGNGFQTNPELEVIDVLAAARLDPTSHATTAEAGTKPFTFWFNCSSTMTNKADQKAYMKKVEQHVATLVKSSKKRLTANFLGPSAPSFSIDL